MKKAVFYLLFCVSMANCGVSFAQPFDAPGERVIFIMNVPSDDQVVFTLCTAGIEVFQGCQFLLFTELNSLPPVVLASVDSIMHLAFRQAQALDRNWFGPEWILKLSIPDAQVYDCGVFILSHGYGLRPIFVEYFAHFEDELAAFSCQLAHGLCSLLCQKYPSQFDCSVYENNCSGYH